jgi:hypothetical protein
MLLKTLARRRFVLWVLNQVEWKSGDRKPWRHQHIKMYEVQLTLACLNIENTTQTEKLYKKISKNTENKMLIVMD